MAPSPAHRDAGARAGRPGRHAVARDVEQNTMEVAAVSPTSAFQRTKRKQASSVRQARGGRWWDKRSADTSRISLVRIDVEAWSVSLRRATPDPHPEETFVEKDGAGSGRAQEVNVTLAKAKALGAKSYLVEY